MHLKSTKRKNKNGTTDECFQLTSNACDSQLKKHVALIIFSFGLADQFDRDYLVRLCHSIARFCDIGIDEKNTGGINQLKCSQEHERLQKFTPLWLSKPTWKGFGSEKHYADSWAAKETIRATKLLFW